MIKTRAFNFRVFFIIMAVLATSPAFAQILIEGTIKDKETKEGIPFAHVYVEGTTTVAVSDVDGVFVIDVPQEEAEFKLVISSVGYNNFEQTPAKIQMNQTKEFLLESAVFDLDLAVVKSPEKILKDAMSKIDENYWTEPFMVEGFYRKGALENDRFAYLTEAIIQYYNKGYHKKDKTSIDINIVQLRNSEDFRQVKMIQHHNPIYNALYNFDKVKTRRILEKLNTTKMGTAKMEVSVYNGESIYIINLSGLKIYVGFDNDKIYRIDTKGKRDVASSFQYRAYKGKLYPFYFRIKHFVKDGNKIGEHMITDYKGQDIRGLADSLAEATVNGGSLEGRLPMVEQRTKEIMVEMSKEILKETDLDLIGYIQEFVATDVIIKSEKKYKRKTNLDIHKDLFETEIFYDLDVWNNFPSYDFNRTFKKRSDDTFLFPKLPLLDFSVFIQASQFCAGSGSTGRTVISFSRTQYKIFAVNTWIFRRREKLNMIDYCTIFTSDILRFKCTSNLP